MWYNPQRMRGKAVVLFSGGLDSLLCAKIIENMGFEPLLFVLMSPFASLKNALDGAKTLKLPLFVEDFSREIIEAVKRPRFGYGQGINPCIDCRIKMYRRAKEFMLKAGALFVATGEVLGQRPMTQRKEVLLMMEKEAGLEGLVVRPLSGKLLPETAPEREGILERGNMLDIWGRSRKRQIELAGRFGIEKYPSPAGGCLLCDPSFAKRMRALMRVLPDFSEKEVKVIKHGRMFETENALLVVSRGPVERAFFPRLFEDVKKEAWLLVPLKTKGDVGIVLGNPSAEEVEIFGKIVARYTLARKQGKPAKIRVKDSIMVVEPAPEEVVASFAVK